LIRLTLLVLAFSPALGFAQALPGEQPSSVSLIDAAPPPLTDVQPDLKRFVELQDRLLALEVARPSVAGPAVLFILGADSLIGSIALGIVLSSAVLAIVGSVVGVAFFAFGIMAASSNETRLREIAMEQKSIRDELVLFRLPVP
jgi:hypothetical protein